MSSGTLGAGPNWSWVGARSPSEAAGAVEPRAERKSADGERGGDEWVVVMGGGPGEGRGAGAGEADLAALGAARWALMDRRLEGEGLTRWPASAGVGRLIPRIALVTSPRSESVGEAKF